jgi:Short C-terminal domain
MTMRTLAISRQHRPDLLARPPCVASMYDDRWAALVVDPTDQLKTLADLLARGLLSTEEYERHKAKVLER